MKTKNIICSFILGDRLIEKVNFNAGYGLRGVPDGGIFDSFFTPS